jgi:predicted alpha-1,6-mannanase (GH76 family)
MRQITMLTMFLILALALLSGCALRSAHDRQSVSSVPTLSSADLQRSKAAIERLQEWYRPADGLYQTAGWWNSANALTVLADYSRASGSTQYNSVFANTFIEAQKKNASFLNRFYDDEGWWALAWIDVYDVTRNPQYLTMAETIFSDMAQAWDGTCGGGIWWSKDRKYKNAIANELFLSVAAHLANRTMGTARKEYIAWGNQEWNWFHATGMINSGGLINDGLGKGPGEVTGANCTNNHGTIWSYNQGVILGGLAELSVANHDPSLPQAAQKIAMAAITQLADENGILRDPCEPKCGADGVQFKGIFVRNLVLLDQRHRQRAYEIFVQRNADAIWSHARGPNFQLDETWTGPFTAGSASAQSSALDALVGALYSHV